MTTITFRNIAMMLATCPLTVIFKKMPKIWSGSNGMITASIIRITMSRKSPATSFSAVPLI